MALVLVALLFAGCISHSLERAGEHPGYLRGNCGADGAMVTIQGTLAVGPGGAGNNAVSVNCRGSFTLEQGRAPAPPLLFGPAPLPVPSPTPASSRPPQ